MTIGDDFIFSDIIHISKNMKSLSFIHFIREADKARLDFLKTKDELSKYMGSNPMSKFKNEPAFKKLKDKLIAQKKLWYDYNHAALLQGQDDNKNMKSIKSLYESQSFENIKNEIVASMVLNGVSVNDFTIKEIKGDLIVKFKNLKSANIEKAYKIATMNSAIFMVGDQIMNYPILLDDLGIGINTDHIKRYAQLKIKG